MARNPTLAYPGQALRLAARTDGPYSSVGSEVLLNDSLRVDDSLAGTQKAGPGLGTCIGLLAQTERYAARKIRRGQFIRQSLSGCLGAI